MRGIFFYIAIALFFIIIFSISHASSSQEPIRIGLTLALTGKFAPMGNAQMNGFKIWEKHINEKGGLLGRKIELIIYDDNSDSETAKKIYEKMIVKEKIDFLFGPYSSPITEAVLPVTEEYGHPLLISGASGNSLWEKNYKNAIGVYTTTDRIPQGFLELLIKNNIKKIAVVYADDLFSTDLANGFVSWAKKFNMEILMKESFKKDTSDLTYLAKKTKDSGAETLILSGHFNEAVDMRKALKAINYYPRAYYAYIGAALDDYHEKLGKDANYTFSSSLWEIKANFPGAKKFYTDYLNAFNKTPQYHSAIAYASGQVLEEAVKRSNSFDRKKIREILFKMDIITIIGRYGIDRTGRQVRQHVFITQWQKGKKELLWHERLATAKPIFK